MSAYVSFQPIFHILCLCVLLWRLELGSYDGETDLLAGRKKHSTSADSDHAKPLTTEDEVWYDVIHQCVVSRLDGARVILLRSWSRDLGTNVSQSPRGLETKTETLTLGSWDRDPDTMCQCLKTLTSRSRGQGVKVSSRSWNQDLGV